MTSLLININKAILHILDYNSNVTVFSEQELDLASGSVLTFLSKHLEKSQADPNMKSGSFFNDSKFKSELDKYLASDLDFISFSTFIAEKMADYLSRSDKLDSHDLIVCDFSIDDRRQIAILVCNNRMGFVHHVVTDNAKVKSEIINHYAILPSLSQKLNEYVFIDPATYEIKFYEKKRSIEGQDICALSELLLECSSTISPKDVVKIVQSITEKVAENHGENTALAMSKAKNFISENIEHTEKLDPIELGMKVFESSEILQKEFVREIKEAKVPENVTIDKPLAVKTGKNHKIKTDTGIEITFPVDYFKNSDYLEFINNPDGTISIQIKNIGKLINK